MKIIDKALVIFSIDHLFFGFEAAFIYSCIAMLALSEHHKQHRLNYEEFLQTLRHQSSFRKSDFYRGTSFFNAQKITKASGLNGEGTERKITIAYSLSSQLKSNACSRKQTKEL